MFIGNVRSDLKAERFLLNERKAQDVPTCHRVSIVSANHRKSNELMEYSFDKCNDINVL